jgi:putative ABC transport system ATP-binding protein
MILKNIHKTYLLGVEGVSALRGINLEVKEGDFLIIYGSSGGGKTSLLNVMGTIDKPTKGDLIICGHKIKSNTEDSIMAGLRLSYLGFVF